MGRRQNKSLWRPTIRKWQKFCAKRRPARSEFQSRQRSRAGDHRQARDADAAGVRWHRFPPVGLQHGCDTTLCWSEPASNSRSPGRHRASLSVAVTFRPDYFLRREIRSGEMRRSEISLVSRGTDGSNPASSSRESANHQRLSAEDNPRKPL